MTSIDDAVRVRELLYAHPDHAEFQAGSAEPWIANVLAALVVANDTRVAIEIGGFQGFSSRRIARALAKLPHSTTLTVCEIDKDRAWAVQNALDDFVLSDVKCKVVFDDSLRWLPTLAPESVDLAWLDGNHELAHVEEETRLLLPKMSRRGLLCYHDVWGVCDLQRVVRKYGGIALDLPRLGPAGGLGIVQVL